MRKLSVNGHLNGDTTGRHRMKAGSVAYIVLLAVGILLVVILAARIIMRTKSTQAWVARKPLTAGQTIQAGDLIRKSVSKEAVTAGVYTNPNQLVGKTVQRPVDEGKPLTTEDVASPSAQALSQTLPEGRVLATVRISGATMLPVQALRQGDRFDVVAISRKSGAARVVARDVWLQGWLYGKAPARQDSPMGRMIPPAAFGERRPVTGVVALVLGLYPHDVVPLTQADSMGDNLRFALHGRQEVLSGNQLFISSPRQTAGIELILGAKRERVVASQ